MGRQKYDNKSDNTIRKGNFYKKNRLAIRQLGLRSKQHKTGFELTS